MLFKPLFILAIAMSAEPQSTGGMRLLAKAAPRISLSSQVARELIVHGASEQAVRNQVEVALRRCGFTVVENNESAGAAVGLNGLAHKNFGYFGNAHVSITLPMNVSGESVLIFAFDDGFIFSGSPGTAESQVRSVIAQLLDKFCNQYLQARDEVRSEKEKQP